jgi:hypothetical protein
MGRTQPPIKQVWENYSGVKRPVYEADSSHFASADVRNLRMYNCVRHTAS